MTPAQREFAELAILEHLRNKYATEIGRLCQESDETGENEVSSLRDLYGTASEVRGLEAWDAKVE